MQFRTINDLMGSVRNNLHKIPRDIDIVVGIPRSGLLAGCAVALAINKPFVELNNFLEGRIELGFSRRLGSLAPGAGRHLSALIVDDSIHTGTAMTAVRQAVDAKHLPHHIFYAAIYGVHASHPETDIVLELCSSPRIFEWNVMNQAALDFCCVDLDGVLCVDPAIEENDDGPRYLDFLQNARPLNLPRYPIHSIVTARLERYRAQTEMWLKRNEVQYKNLIMLDVPSAEERRRLRMHGKFKAQIYANQQDCLLFIESEIKQAKEIHKISGKPVLAYRDMKYISQMNSAKFLIELRAVVGRILPQGTKLLIKSALKLS